MYAQVRFSLVTPQEVTGALKATGSTDPDILAAAKDQIAAPYRPLKWFGIWGIVTGTLCCLLVILAFIGVPIIIFGIWALRRSKKNRETIEKAYAEYVGKVTGQPPLVPGDLRAVGLVLLTLMGGAGAASAQVPAEFHGDWVSARATCDAAVRFRVEAAKFTLINGKDTQSFGGIEMAGPSYFGPEYNGIQAVAISEFEGDQPVTASLSGSAMPRWARGFLQATTRPNARCSRPSSTGSTASARRSRRRCWRKPRRRRRPRSATARGPPCWSPPARAGIPAWSG